jgi:hypothetical protein
MSPATKEKDLSDDPSKDPMWFMITVIMNTEAKKLEKVRCHLPSPDTLPEPH